MKTFIGVLIACLVCGYVVLIALSPLLGELSYVAVAMIAVAVLITLLVKLDKRIDELEKKVEQLSETGCEKPDDELKPPVS